LKYEWTGKNVSIDELVEHIKVFFTENDFKVGVDKSNGSYHVTATSNFRVEKTKLFVTVKVSGEADDFTIEFTPNKGMNAVWMTSSLTSLFGGNWFLLRNLRLKEKLDRIERSFWSYIGLVIADSGR